MKNLIFLDIDGVLNSRQFFHSREKYTSPDASYGEVTRDAWDIDNQAVVLLKKICDETNSIIVVSSTWRSATGCYFDLSWWDELFRICGWDNPPIVGRTAFDSEMPFAEESISEDGTTERVLPTFSELKGGCGLSATIDGHHRGHQIVEWLQENPGDYNYVVVDDDWFDIENIIPKDRFFVTEFRYGLTEEISDAIIKRLSSNDKT